MKQYAVFSKRGGLKKGGTRGNCLTRLTQYPSLRLLFAVRAHFHYERWREFLCLFYCFLLLCALKRKEKQKRSI